MKKLTERLTALMLCSSVMVANAQWSKSYNDPAINGVPSDDVAYAVEMESNGTSYVAGVINNGLNTQDVRLMKYSSTGSQLGTFTHSTPAHKETVRFMVTGTDNNLYVITNAGEIGNNLSYIKVMKYSKTMQFLSAMTYSNPIYYIPTVAAVDVAGTLFISCTKKNPMGGTGELAILKVGQNLMIQSVFTYSYQFPGDGYHVNVEGMFVEAGAVYVGGHINQGGFNSSRTLLIKVNSSTMTSQFIKIGALNTGRNSFASLYVTNKYIYVIGTVLDATVTTQRFHKFSGLLEATQDYVNLPGQTNGGRKITKIGGTYYMAYSITYGAVTDLKLNKIDGSTLVSLSTSTQSIPYQANFNSILITQDMVLATGGAIVSGNWQMFMSTLKVGGLSTFTLNSSGKSTGLALAKRTGGFIATGWQDKSIAPALPDNEFFTQYIPDVAIMRLQDDNKDLTSMQMTVYPNPASQQLTISGLTAGHQIKIIDAHGRLLLTGIAEVNGEVQLDVRNLSAGVYILESEGLRTKFVKQ